MPDLPETESELRRLNAELRELVKQGATGKELQEVRSEINNIKTMLEALKKNLEAPAPVSADDDDWRDIYDRE
jgi:archaellum component FlaC